MKDQFAEVSQRVWEAYHAPGRMGFGQRVAGPEVGREHLGGVKREDVVGLRGKGRRFVVAYRHPGHRTSNMLDGQTWEINRHFPPNSAMHYPQLLMMEFSWGGWNSKLASGPGSPRRR